jgi:hypothetical protein
VDRGEWLWRCAARFRQIVDVDAEEADALAVQNAVEEAAVRGGDPAGWRDPEAVANEDVRVWAGRVKEV